MMQIIRPRRTAKVTEEEDAEKGMVKEVVEDQVSIDLVTIIIITMEVKVEAEEIINGVPMAIEEEEVVIIIPNNMASSFGRRQQPNIVKPWTKGYASIAVLMDTE